MTNKIPIRNIFYMLSYAWDRLKQTKSLNVDFKEIESPRDLLVRLLICGTNHILRRGLWRDYVEINDVTPVIRGKIMLNASLRSGSIIHGKLSCTLNHLSPNKPINQIIYTTIREIIKAKKISRRHHEEVRHLLARISNVDQIPLSPKIFDEVRTHKNNAYYDLVLQVCRLLYLDLMADESQALDDFFDFERNHRDMALLFEHFVRNFYKREQTKYRVERRLISWIADPIDEISNGYLPVMKTDICLESVTGDESIIIDTKFYESTLNSQFGKERLRSENLYQIYSYLTQSRLQASYDGRKLKGVLLYPETKKSLNLHFRFQQDFISVCTLDLSRDWEEIHHALLGLLFPEQNSGDLSRV